MCIALHCTCSLPRERCNKALFLNPLSATGANMHQVPMIYICVCNSAEVHHDALQANVLDHT